MSSEKDQFLPIKGVERNFCYSETQCSEMSFSPERLLPMPIPAYDGQLFKEFEKGLNLYSVKQIMNGDNGRGFQTGKAIMPEVILKLCTIENGYFIVAPGLDGVIVNNDYRIIESPSCFRNRSVDKEGFIKNIPFKDSLDNVFVGFDAAPTNYYHWLLYAISKTIFADNILSSNVQLAVPSIQSLFNNRGVSFSSSTYEQILSISGLKNRVTYLDTGIYPVKNLSYCWHTPSRMPELYLLFAEVYSIFDKIKVPYFPALPTKFYISRGKGNDQRITGEENIIIESVLQKKNIKKVYLEDMDFVTQVALFKQAEFVMAPHGAGLANMVFARIGTPLLELNLQIGQPHLRDCFYLIAAARRHPYSCFNLSKDKLTEEHLLQAINRLKPDL